MNTYRCLRKEVWFRGFMFKKNDEFTGEHPACGKGSDLTKGPNPIFEIVSGPQKKEIPVPEDTDPRSDKEIRDDILSIFGHKVHPNMKRSNLLIKEKQLTLLKGKDHVQQAETEYKVLP